MELEDAPPGFAPVHVRAMYSGGHYAGQEYLGHPQRPEMNLRALGGRLDGLDSVGPGDVWRLTCISQRVTDAALDHLSRLTGLEELVLTGTAVTDAGMHTLARLPKLRHLTVNECDITDVGLATIAVIDSLTELELYGTKVTGAGLKSLLRHPNLAVLDLRHTKVRDGLETLVTIPHLRELRLSWWAERRSASFRDQRPEVVIV